MNVGRGFLSVHKEVKLLFEHYRLFEDEATVGAMSRLTKADVLNGEEVATVDGFEEATPCSSSLMAAGVVRPEEPRIRMGYQRISIMRD